MIQSMKRPAYRDIQGRYERFVLLVHGRAASIYTSRVLEGFFGMFPKLREIHEFHKTEVEDYRVIRLRVGHHPIKVNKEVQVLKRFWAWMLDRELVLVNIASVRPLKAESKKRQITLEEFWRLLREIHDPRIIQVVKGVLSGLKMTEASAEAGLSYGRVYQLFLEAARRCGLDIQLSSLRRLSKDLAFAFLAQHLHEQSRDTLLVEA